MVKVILEEDVARLELSGWEQLGACTWLCGVCGKIQIPYDGIQKVRAAGEKMTFVQSNQLIRYCFRQFMVINKRNESWNWNASSYCTWFFLVLGRKRFLCRLREQSRTCP
jgi:hypothetical protein